MFRDLHRSAAICIFHPLLALIASATDRQLARYVECLNEENKILHARIQGQMHTRPDERKRLLKIGKSIGRAIEELITIVTLSSRNRSPRHSQRDTSERIRYLFVPKFEWQLRTSDSHNQE